MPTMAMAVSDCMTAEANDSVNRGARSPRWRTDKRKSPLCHARAGGMENAVDEEMPIKPHSAEPSLLAERIMPASSR